MLNAKDQLREVLQNFNAKGFDKFEFDECAKKFLKDINCDSSIRCTRNLKYFLFCLVLIICTKYYFSELNSKQCMLNMPLPLRYAFRPPESCHFCENVYNIPRVRDITKEEFSSKYAYSGAPVIVEDATKNWTALTKFDYWYFKEVYENSQRKDKVLDCQFLPYKTGFRNIFQALSMDRNRVELAADEEPWYFGWSNCNSETAEEFRKHYDKPYFLPNTSENGAVDWFFIGTAGLGAHMHIDNVRLPSWQAQLSGNKRWLLAPPPECFFQCQQISGTVHKGDIIVLDTNKWYHQTFVEPGEISLTVGAEYD